VDAPPAATGSDSAVTNLPYAVAEPDSPARETPPTITPARALRAFRRRWYLAIPVGLVVAAAAWLGAREYIPSVYTARTQVHLAVNQPLFDKLPGGVDLATYQRRQTALIRSRHVLQTALQRPGVSELQVVKSVADPVGWLEGELKVDFSVSPEIMRITLSGADPRELLVLLDAIREAYLAEGVNKETTDKQTALQRIRFLIDEDKAKLDEANRAATAKAEEFRAPDAAAARQRHQTDLTRLTNLQTLLFQLEVQVQGWEQARQDLEARPPEKEPPVVVRPADLKAATELALAKDTEYQAARAEVARLESELKRDRQVAKNPDQSPKILEKEKELQAARAEVDTRERTARDTVQRQLETESKKGLGDRQADHRLRLMELHGQISRGKAQMSTLATEIKKLDADTLTAARRIAELDRLLAAASVIEDRIKAGKARAENLETDLKSPPRAQTDEVAVITQVPNPAKKSRYMLGAAAVGLVAGLFGVLYLDLRTGRVDSLEEVDKRLRTGVVGCIPRVKPDALAALARPTGGSLLPSEALVCNAADACRTLLIDPVPGATKVIMVTSAHPGEGKTTLATQLALSLGRAGYRTLLVDGDLRDPDLHCSFGRSLSPGLADVLRKTHPIQHVVRKGPIPNLGIIPAGQCNSQEAVALLQHRLGSLLRKCKPYFEVILIDAPPLLNMPDAMVIGRHCDGTILSLMNDVSTFPAAEAACGRLRTMNLPLLGTVLNAARFRAPRGYY
jgi:capsular exopolysaccharide synthesis family protein